MRGKRAKRLMEMSQSYVQHQLKKPLGEGYNEYYQVDNRYSMQPILDEDGFPKLDPEGMALLAPKLGPGTIHCAWNVRVVYQRLKKATRGRQLFGL